MEEFASLVDLAAERARARPQYPTFTFLGDQEGEVARLTNAELDRRARALAAVLQQDRCEGERVLIIAPPGLDYIAAFFGCLYAGAVAVPAYPPGMGNIKVSLARLEAIVADARPTALFMTALLEQLKGDLIERAPALGGLRWLSADSSPQGIEQVWKAPPRDPERVAFLQYTSGSTGRPKGVMVSHANLLTNMGEITRVFGAGAQDHHVCWLPPFHDMGLIGGILWPLHLGIDVTLMSPLAFLQRPARWVRAMSDTRATVTGAANFGYDIAARKTRPEEREGLDLSTLKVACLGGEPVRRATLDRFTEAFAPVGFDPAAFFPSYGMSEVTLMATGGTRDDAPTVRAFSRISLSRGRAEPARDQDSIDLVACGTAVGGLDVIVVDPESGELLEEGAIGEIWIAGSSVAHGYWRQPELSERTFSARLTRPEDRRRHPGSFLRTGDLGFQLGGEQYITGRRKDLIIVRGRNIHPEDVESGLDSVHPRLRPGGAAVFSCETGTDERVVVVHELDEGEADYREVARAIRYAVQGDHDIRLHAVVLLRARALPKTTSGKVMRHACREAIQSGLGIEGTVFEWRRGVRE